MNIGEKFVELLSQVKTSTALCEFEAIEDELVDHLARNTEASVLEVELVEKFLEFLEEERVKAEDPADFDDDEEEEEESEGWFDEAWA